MRFTKLTVSLLMTTVLATMVSVPESAYGAQFARRAKAKAEAEAKAKEAVRDTDTAKQEGAIAHPDQALNGGGAFGGALLAALDAATNDANSAATTGHNTANIQERITALRAIEGEIGNAGAHNVDKTIHIPAVKLALGIDKETDADAKAFIVRFAQIAEREHVTLPGKTKEAKERTKQVAALKNPRYELLDAQPLGTALQAARADGANSLVGAGAPYLDADMDAKLAALELLANNNIWGGVNVPGTHDVAVHFPAVVKALGIKDVPDAGKKVIIDDFIASAREKLIVVPQVGVALAGLGGMGYDQQLNNIKTRLDAATYNAATGVPIGPAGAASVSITAALTRIGL